MIPKKIRNEFEDLLTGQFVLRDIERFFENHDINSVPLPHEKLSSSQRRNLIRAYYNGIDWDNEKNIKKLLGVYSDILNEIAEKRGTLMYYGEGDYYKNIIDKFTSILNKNGFDYDGHKILPKNSSVDLKALNQASSILDKNHFYEHTERIRKSIDEDPGLAVGSTKELIESVLKTILVEMREYFSKNADVPKLLKQVQKKLKLAPEDTETSIKGAETIKTLLSNLGQIVIKIDELRNLYGTGHGKATRNVLTPRHARLVVGSGITLVTFLLETFEKQFKKTSSL